MSAPGRPEDVFRIRPFLIFWLAETASGFGLYVTAIAVQVLIVLMLMGTATDIGVLNAIRWLPSVVLGVVIGAVIDRYPRKPILITADLGRAVLLGAVPALWLAGWLSIPVLLVLAAAFGMLSLPHDAAAKSFLPRLVPPAALLAANARLDQGTAVGRTLGPVAGGALVTLLGAPFAFLVHAAACLCSAVAISTIRLSEPKPAATEAARNLGREIVEGFNFVYRHRTLAPLALSTHGWILCNAMVGTIFVPFLLLELDLSPIDLGIALTAAGVAGLAGALFARRLGTVHGAGRTVIAARALMPFAWALIALVPGAGGDHMTIMAMLIAGQALHGFGMGVQNANDKAYRQAVTPDALQGRMTTTTRSINRAMVVVGAPLGGILADSIGFRTTLWLALAGFALFTAWLAASPFRHARHGETSRADVKA